MEDKTKYELFQRTLDVIKGNLVALDYILPYQKLKKMIMTVKN